METQEAKRAKLASEKTAEFLDSFQTNTVTTLPSDYGLILEYVDKNSFGYSDKEVFAICAILITLRLKDKMKQNKKTIKRVRKEPFADDDPFLLVKSIPARLAIASLFARRVKLVKNVIITIFGQNYMFDFAKFIKMSDDHNVKRADIVHLVSSNVDDFDLSLVSPFFDEMVMVSSRMGEDAFSNLMEKLDMPTYVDAVQRLALQNKLNPSSICTVLPIVKKYCQEFYSLSDQEEGKAKLLQQLTVSTATVKAYNIKVLETIQKYKTVSDKLSRPNKKHRKVFDDNVKYEYYLASAKLPSSLIHTSAKDQDGINFVMEVYSNTVFDVQAAEFVVNGNFSDSKEYNTKCFNRKTWSERLASVKDEKIQLETAMGSYLNNLVIPQSQSLTYSWMEDGEFRRKFQLGSKPKKVVVKQPERSPSPIDEGDAMSSSDES